MKYKIFRNNEKNNGKFFARRISLAIWQELTSRNFPSSLLPRNKEEWNDCFEKYWQLQSFWSSGYTALSCYGNLALSLKCLSWLYFHTGQCLGNVCWSHIDSTINVTGDRSQVAFSHSDVVVRPWFSVLYFMGLCFNMGCIACLHLSLLNWSVHKNALSKVKFQSQWQPK